MKITAIIWDFDGVIIDSVPTKTAAFASIFSGFPKDKVEELLEYHRVNGGISRFEKIEYFFKQIIKQPLSPEDAKKYADAFLEFSMKELHKPSYLIPSTIEFIKAYHNKIPMHIASGAWEVDLNALCQIHGLSDYFISIHGSPTLKTLWVKDILEKYGYNPAQTAMIGDSIQDYQAAKDNGILYYGFNNEDMRPLADVYLDDYSPLV